MRRYALRYGDAAHDVHPFERTWGARAGPRPENEYSSEVIPGGADVYPDVLFIAEAYWDKEWELQQQGFDYCYDKRLYDRPASMTGRSAAISIPICPIRRSLFASSRTTTNPGPPRPSRPGVHEAEAIITFLSTGLRFFHQGQFEGRRKRFSPHLVRAPKESTDDTLHRFYDRLFAVLRQRVVRDGQWRLLDSVPAWDGNGTWDSFRIFAWQGPGKERLLVTVNYAATHSQCYVRLPFSDLAGNKVRL